MLTCPGDLEVPSAAGGPVPVTFTSPAQRGGTAPVTVSCSPASGMTFALGPTRVSCTASDGAGRTATCGFGVNVTAIPQLTRTRFLTFGDSLTEGKLSLTLSLLVDSPSHSYPAKLLQKLRERYTAQEITLINEGLGGEKATESVSRFREALDTHRPEAVLVMHGVNDLNGVDEGRVQAAVDALEELVKAAKDEGATTFVATLPPLGPGGKAGCPECVDPYNDRIRAMVSAKGAVLVDVHEAWGTRTDLMGADGIHPTEAGYEVIATQFFDAIRRTLEKPLIP
jgi:lysophospholipase L1-like esterase